MVKIESGKAVREPVPDFLDRSGTPEALAALADLSWTDPALGVQGSAWWPEENGDGELGTDKKWGAEVLTLDTERQVVLVTRKQVAMTAAEKAARDALVAEQWAAQIAARRYDAENFRHRRRRHAHCHRRPEQGADQRRGTAGESQPRLRAALEDLGRLR